jgi:hypothetical protein
MVRLASISPRCQNLFVLFVPDYAEPDDYLVQFYRYEKARCSKSMFISSLFKKDLIWNFSYVRTVNKADSLQMLSLLAVPLLPFLTHIPSFIS